MGRNKAWSSTGIKFGPNVVPDLPRTVNNKSISILFAEDTCILVTS
jgi:hypothetical protein